MAKTISDHTIIKQVCISIFAIFLGSQITEGVLLVPHWQSLSAEEFYDYYGKFGPMIGRFYTILTIMAALIPIAVATRYLIIKGKGVKYAMVSAVFAMFFIACFYIYFKGTNELFYARSFNEKDLAQELITWSYWHWGRIGLEIISLIFLIRAFGKSNIQPSHS